MPHAMTPAAVRRLVLVVLMVAAPATSRAQSPFAPVAAWPIAAAIPAETRVEPPPGLLSPGSLGLEGAPTASQPRRARPDRLTDGVLIGAGVGFAAGFLGWAAYNAKQTDSGSIWTAECVGIYTSMGLMGAGIGAVVGLVVDAVHRRAPAPMLAPKRVMVAPEYTRRRTAVLVSIRY